MSKHDPIAIVPTPDEVRAALQRIVVSNVFSASPQLAAFLSFVVEAALHGNSDRIKGYTIGVEVLRRDPKFDPQLDPIARRGDPPAPGDRTLLCRPGIDRRSDYRSTARFLCADLQPPHRDIDRS